MFQPPFSSSMTRSPSTTLHRVFPQLFLTPPQPFGFTPHLSSHLLLTPQIVSSSARSLPTEPANALFSSFRHRSRESWHSQQPPRSTTKQPCRPARILGAVGSCHDSAWTTATVFLFRRTGSALPELYRTKGTCVTDLNQRPRAAHHM
jgi:hypothetical protein